MTNYSKKLVFESTPGTGAYSDCAKWTIKYVWEGVPDPAMGRNIGWRDLVKDTYQSAVDGQCTAMVAEWADVWKSYEIPQPLVSDLQFPKCRDEKMEEQEKRKQEETDRYFAWLGAKHALRAVETEHRHRSSQLDAARLNLDRANARMKGAESRYEMARKALVAAREVVNLLQPPSQPGMSLPGE